jgi:hypothetical protein
MKNRFPRLALFLLAMLAASLAVSVTSALGHGGGRGGGPGGGPGGASANELVAEAAEQLDVTTAQLRTAIVNAAIARIDEAVEDEDVEAEDADELKERARDNLRYAMKISRTRVVAANLDITAAKLNTGFRAARKALVTARIDKAVEDGDLDSEEAAELKEELAETRLPGYKAIGLGLRGFGLGLGPGGFGCRR